MILVPNKELANQVLRMAIPLCGGPTSVIWNGSSAASLPPGGGELEEEEDDDSNRLSPTGIGSSHPSHMIRLGIVPGNLNTPEDYKPFRMVIQDPVNHPPLDLVITTPASLDRWGLNPKFIDFFADIQTLVIDEADMLFDGGYIRSLENVLLGFKRADRLDSSYGVAKTQYVLVAATVPDMGLKSVHAYIQRKFPRANRITMKGMHNARHYGLQYKTQWIEDDSTVLEDQVKRKRMEKLIQLLQKSSATSGNVGELGLFIPDTEFTQGLKDEKVMIFLNSVEDVDAVTKALMRVNIPAVPYHAKIPLDERVRNLDRFRKYTRYASSEERNDVDVTIPVMVCTDLAARGLDIPGVTVVVQLQFAGNVVSHLHRMGRCGRAGNRNGRGIIFYGNHERELVTVIQKAENQQDRMVLAGDVMEPDISEDEIDSTAPKAGKVDDAFSRKRGFTKKRKKLEKKE
jgi:superfamily II DNA/RNA helicase